MYRLWTKSLYLAVERLNFSNFVISLSPPNIPRDVDDEMRSRIKKTPGPGRLNGCLEELQEAHVLGDRRYAKFVVGRRDWVVCGGIDGLIFEWSESGCSL